MTAGMATTRPMAVVMRASEIPPATAARPWTLAVAMPLKAFKIPTTVPKSPTKGAVEPMVAKLPSPLFSSAWTIASVRSKARFEASTISPGISVLAWCARNSIRPACTTLAKWLLLLRSATLIASSRFPCFKAPATAGANDRDWLRAALKASKRSIITPIDHPDMMNRMPTTILASIPIDLNIATRSTLLPVSAACSQAATRCVWLNTAFATLATNMSRFLLLGYVSRSQESKILAIGCQLSAHSQKLLIEHGIRQPTADSRQPHLLTAQRELDFHCCIQLDRIPVQQIRLVAPLLHGIDGGRGQHRRTTHQREPLNCARFTDDGMQHNRTLHAGRLG